MHIRVRHFWTFFTFSRFPELIWCVFSCWLTWYTLFFRNRSFSTPPNAFFGAMFSIFACFCPRVRALIELAPRGEDERVGRVKTSRLVSFFKVLRHLPTYDVTKTWILEIWPRCFWLITFDLIEIQTCALRHRVSLVKTRQMVYFLTSKGQINFWP